jgi:hypothetical protein
MKTKLLSTLTAIVGFLIPNVNFAQAPTLGTAVDFVLFSTNGSVSNTGISQLTGNVGTNNGSAIAFGNVNGVMNNQNGASSQCATDLLIAYNQLDATAATFVLAPSFGNGDTIIAGVYSISAAATLNSNLTLNAESDPNAVFIIKIQGSLSTNAGSKIKLINGAQACNVFWKVEGLVDMASGTVMRGTVIANNAAINMSANDTLEGRALSTGGAITINGVLAYTPIGCGSAVLAGPTAPALATTECYAVFSSSGSVTNSGITYVTGDVGTNVGLTTGFDTLLVTGEVHPIPDASTATCAADLLNVYNYLNTLPYDIELLYPAQFGNNLVLTPHTYIMNGSTTFTDTLFLNAGGYSNAVFVIKIYGALSTSTYSRVRLINGTQAKNVYWMVSGAVSIADYSEFNGTIICNNGAVDLSLGTILNGRALTTVGTLSTNAITVNMPTSCSSGVPIIGSLSDNKTVCEGSSVSFSVVATGASLTYQWRKGTVNLVNGGNISGALTATLTIHPVTIADTASNYNVVVTGISSQVTTSDNIVLSACGITGITAVTANQTVTIYPNPFNTATSIVINDASQIDNAQLSVYSILGAEVINITVTKQVTTIETANLPSGIYFYKITSGGKIIQSGKLISQQ